MTDKARQTGADYFVNALQEYGVTHLFGNPGTTELPVMNSLADSELQYILGLHEDIAVGMAAGYASTRRYHSHHNPEINPVGVVNLHITPGLAHGLGNLYGSMFANAPLVITAGNHDTGFQHEEPILHGNLVRMAEQFTKWSAEVKDVQSLPTMLRRAFRVARTPPTGPVFLDLPLDVMTAELSSQVEPLGDIPTAGCGAPENLERAAKHLIDATEPILIVGDHVAHSGSQAIEAVVDLAETTGARVHGEILSAEVNFPSSHEQWASFISSREEGAAKAMEADTLVFIGCSTHTTELKHENPLIPDNATCIHLGHDPWQLGKNLRSDATVIGDPGLVAQELNEMVANKLSDNERQKRLQTTKQEIESNWASKETDSMSEEELISKDGLIKNLHELTPDALLVNEAITTAASIRTQWDLQPEHLISNKSGGLGYGLPATVGAAIAEKEGPWSRHVVGIIGDGSYLYYPNTLYSASRYDIDLTVVVPDNRNYRILKDNMQRIFDGSENDYEYIGMDFEPPVDIPANAASHGAKGRFVESPSNLSTALKGALSEDGPSVVDVLVQD
ncbi:thiamine pyrophosphate-binding protein [Natronorubrum tibetense]|uniref:Thiamine pyrophosphate protein TPP binding domain-containing protein n=1 Tax=Natronorubrum tibetense GA33 TaxID=1114856 RepID=L9VKI2_9EURY|nr:thiamine pyrophosphate-binding protein [Natronorubrum tibetense]ELY37720.1 thiamine pyrophosphate protein TPP binding domain-containing protein [Natronorubrum tibetense GA33]